jgi:hypothetical protein
LEAKHKFEVLFFATSSSFSNHQLGKGEPNETSRYLIPQTSKQNSRREGKLEKKWKLEM